MIQTIVDLLRADATLTAILTGGIYNGEVVGEVSRQFTADAYDANDELLPTLLVAEETTVADEGAIRNSANLYIMMYFYDRHAYINTKAARKRVYQILHRTTPVTTDNDKFYQVFHTGDVAGTEDTAIGASLETSRYQAVIQRARP